MDSSGKALKGSGKPVSPAAGCLGPDAGGVDKGCNSLNAWGGSLLTDLLPAKLFCRQLRAWKNATWVEVLRFSALRKTLRWAGPGAGTTSIRTDRVRGRRVVYGINRAVVIS
jgi:hypothetical protein